MNKQEVMQALPQAGVAHVIYKMTTNRRNVATITDASQCRVTDDRLLLGGEFSGSVGLDSILAITAGNLNYLRVPSVALGSDPELFFIKDGQVVPSFKVILEESESVKRDGFQLELNPSADTCRERGGSYIAMAIREAQRIAASAGVELAFSVGHTISDEVWKNTPISVKRFGCHPTENVQEPKHKRVTGLRERFRAGAGHIHLGYSKTAIPDHELLVKVLDIVAGNTLVILDRDEANVMRRKNYGRAGEYRIKPYGLEYRVPSNFWLRHYVLWSLASGLCRNALGIVYSKLGEDLVSRYDMKDIRNAINNNDRDLAIKNLRIFVDFIKEHKLFSGTAFDFADADKFFNWISSDSPLARLPHTTTEETLASWEEKLTVGSMGFERFFGHVS